MGHRDTKLYQDPLYGTELLSPTAVAIIDTPEFQRLAGLRQLGFADVTFRGAHHTRFEHSVGTYFACRAMMRRIVQNHERLGLPHPGLEASDRFTFNPSNAGLPDDHTSAQARWRGITEVASLAALLHDLGHVPFGHTLEDEFTGLYRRHDRIGGPRLYAMLFDESSELAGVFSDDRNAAWLPRISNQELARLIYTILSWKEGIEPPRGFEAVLQQARGRAGANAGQALLNLEDWYTGFMQSRMYHPYMSDIVGNTICADLLDYLPRDRMNLGMESHERHLRIQQYLTIRPGTYREKEGLRLSLMVTPKGRGGQRRDVATSIMDLMRRRYELAERVYYHHKKAAASAMLVKLLELTGHDSWPRDDARIYPAPWTTQAHPGLDDSRGAESEPRSDVPHLAHLSDAEFIDYLGRVPVPGARGVLQRKLYTALRYSRHEFYRTLFVLDTRLVNASTHPVSYFAEQLRGPVGEPSSSGRHSLEAELAAAANAADGDVIIYCPGQHMQAKEVDVRAEIVQNRVVPLRVQKELFVYAEDLRVLGTYYQELWRAYIFASPEVFAESARCQAIVDRFCERFHLEPTLAYANVRGHDFALAEGVTVQRLAAATVSFIEGLPFADTPARLASDLLLDAARDDRTLQLVRGGPGSEQLSERLSALLEIRALTPYADGVLPLRPKEVGRVKRYIAQLHAGTKPSRVAARDAATTFEDFQRDVLTGAVGGTGSRSTNGSP